MAKRLKITEVTQLPAEDQATEELVIRISPNQKKFLVKKTATLRTAHPDMTIDDVMRALIDMHRILSRDLVMTSETKLDTSEGIAAQQLGDDFVGVLELNEPIDLPVSPLVPIESLLQFFSKKKG